MPKANPKPQPTKPKGPNNSLRIAPGENDSNALATARAIMAPSVRHGMANAQLLQKHFDGSPSAPGFGDYAQALRERGDKAADGDLAFVSRMLAAQASTLDTIFAETARRMAYNMGEYMGAAETYARIAMKAQAQCRATLEALTKMHSSKEQTVRHVHVNEGGQAVIADEFHHHASQQTGEQNFGQADKQPHAPGKAGGAAGAGAALPGPNACGAGVPIPGDQGRETVPDARRQG